MSRLISVLAAFSVLATDIGHSQTTPKSSVDITTYQQCIAIPYNDSRSPDDFPNPQTVTLKDFCGRGCKKSWVCDPANVITKPQADDLDKEINAILSSGVCICKPCSAAGTNGYSISIAIIPKIHALSGEDKKLVTKYANDLRNVSWRFGKCDNDMVIVVSKDPKLITLSLGTMVSNIITDTCIKNLLRETESYLIKNTVYKTLKQMVTRLGTALKQKTCEKPEESTQPNITIIAMLVGVGLVTLVCIITVFLQRQGKCKHLQTFRITLPPITVRIRKPSKHHRHHQSKHDENLTHDQEELQEIPLDEDKKSYTEDYVS